jgi:hypothetical protein
MHAARLPVEQTNILFNSNIKCLRQLCQPEGRCRKQQSLGVAVLGLRQGLLALCDCCSAWGSVQQWIS